MGPTATDTTARDGDTASREFVRAAPPPGGLVVSAVGYRTQGRRTALHRGLPSPYLTLIFSLDGPVITGRTPGQATGPDAVRTDIVVGGLHQSPAYVVQPEHEAGIQLAVHPLAARALFGLPAAELAGQLVTDGTDVLGRVAADVRERLCEQDAWSDRFAFLNAYLARRAADAERAGGVRPEVGEAWAWLARHRGAGTLRGLSAHVALSERRLSALFRAETGVTPKQAARLIRFQHAKAAVVRAVAAGARPDLARIAADCGYYDHSHLVRDFQQYTGASPSAWMAEECRNIQAGGHAGGEDWDA
ncbi:helix-turn-helix transcriptional regulator [Streptomyces flavofungini]|uniref:helix-turn-helix transcriptional regulator n=1 Tax=Streptomyces flavofungini TaxID=68200 RepID=UPI0025AFE527|nr:helix-turn-helix transcriptional regulator [Streptomyces flavofungini]WJV49204.1 helix-turn-helix transcriptional regulator [Streptomyces flavofungini]